MKIFHALFSDKSGGLEQAYFDYSEAMANKGHSLVLAIHPEAKLKSQLSQLRQEILSFAPKGYYDLGTIWQLRRAIRQTKPDVVLAHNSRAVSVLKLAMLGLSIPLIGVSHGYKTRRMMRADYLLALTDDMRDHFVKAGYCANRCLVMPNMIRPVALDYRPMNPVPVIGAIGRLVYDKGFHQLVQAMAELSRRGVLCRAVIAGDGIERDSLQRFAADLGVSDLISWTGWVRDKQHFYDTIDLLVFPSLNESFGLVVLEGMTYSKPVIASNTVGPASIIEHEKNGLLFESGDVLGLVEAIERLIENSVSAEQIAKAGRERSQEFSPERFAERLDKLLIGIRDSRSVRSS
jgi:glycosyltransferase involved in cell wall biosynthesis